MPEGHCQYALIRMSAKAHRMRSRLMLATHNQEDVARQGPLITSRWSLFLHFLSCKAGVGAPPVSRFLAYMSEKKILNVLLNLPMNFSNFLHAALNWWKNDFFLMALFDWTSRCCTRVGGVKNRLFRKNSLKIPLFIRKKFFFR